MYQKQFLEKIKLKISSKTSLNEEVAKILDISYDAAHRRTTNKSKFSLQESILLARAFNISLDDLFALTSKELIVVEKTQSINNEATLQKYFEASYQSLVQLVSQKDAHIYYSAKDIPVFYTLKNDRLSHFKYYVWLKLLDPSFRTKQFKDYYPKLSTIQAAQKLGELYKNQNTSEIWDLTTINSTLKQIYFYFKAGQIEIETAVEFCELLKNLLDEISDKVLENNNFKLYYNELILMNNNVFIKTESAKSLYVPFSLLSYFFITDEKTCNESAIFFEKQFVNSKLLNNSGEKEQNSFYFKMMQKVEALKVLIQSEQILDFE